MYAMIWEEVAFFPSSQPYLLGCTVVVSEELWAEKVLQSIIYSSNTPARWAECTFLHKIQSIRALFAYHFHLCCFPYKGLILSKNNSLTHMHFLTFNSTVIFQSYKGILGK